MMRFSDRLGITNLPSTLQIESMNDELKNSLWNLFCTYWDSLKYEKKYPVAKFYEENYFKLPKNKVPSKSIDCFRVLENRYNKMQWWEVYNFIEFILKNIYVFSNITSAQNSFNMKLNYILERELSGFRAIENEIVPISDKNEIASINDAISNTNDKFLTGVNHHLVNALTLLGQKPNPDYHNSIKESMSAVEGICKIYTNTKSGGIDKSLKLLSEKISLHSAFKQGILNFYGYTSDENGIRHPMLQMSDLDFADAKFMLVNCSNLINYFKYKFDKYHVSVNES